MLSRLPRLAVCGLLAGIVWHVPIAVAVAQHRRPTLVTTWAMALADDPPALAPLEPDEPAAPSRQDEPEEPEEPDEPPGLLGYCLHGRDGITAEYVYTGEVFTNMRGGISTRRATEYAGLFDLTLTADLDEMNLFPGGQIVVFGQEIHGRGITEDYVGDRQVLSNIDAPPRAQVSEYYWVREWLDGDIRLQLGKQDANADFAVVPLAGDFINSSFGYHPTIPMPTYPDPSMAAVVFLNLREGLVLGAGVWDGEPDGRNWGFSGTGVTFSIYEMELHFELVDGLPGQAHGGIWYHSGQWEDLDSPIGAEVTGNYGAEFEMQQILFRERPCDDEDEQGLGAFCQYGWAPPDRNDLEHYVGAGLVYHGPFDCRDEDILGLAVAHVIFSDRLPDQSTETAVELFYKAQLSSYVMVQPDLQYIARPSGRERDAFVFGLRFELVL